MEQLLSHQAVDWREGRRFRAWELGCQRWRQKDIAAAPTGVTGPSALGVTNGAVSQWLKRAREEGPEALRRRKAPGPSPRLTQEQRAELPRLLEQGAEAHGFRGALWTEGRIAQVIRQNFGVSYHPAHVGRILRACGWSLQKPVRRATQRDEQAIRTWREERWPQVKKSRGGEAHHRLRRRVGILSAAFGDAHLRALRADPGAAGTADQGSPVGNQRRYT